MRGTWEEGALAQVSVGLKAEVLQAFVNPTSQAGERRPKPDPNQTGSSYSEIKGPEVKGNDNQPMGEGSRDRMPARTRA